MADSLNEDIVEDTLATQQAGDTPAAAASAENADLPFAQGGPNDTPMPHTTFLQYLTSPTVTLMVSPYFADRMADFAGDGSPRQIELPNEDLDAMGCFLEFLYTGDYFPKKIAGQRNLEKDVFIPDLLKHAKVYTLADKFGLNNLKSLASSKIHCVNSTAKGEIAYVRYVYEYTAKDDTSTASHTLRAEAEDEFRNLCLEFPQFSYDVLTSVLDEKLKRERNEKMHPASGSARKRPRHSSAINA
ncbi:hypothetical protein QBC36DRAFT_344862 [Triangularia setosa]|uniref:BTB domain-containing protein n=1 Tax=Triangularia setosa TaxID=2587417 RepID=A0AAN6WA16_9PEZI|nr:hypothetical protein QBC36DRAFT_344862 [Podospora setosa]